MIDSENEIKVVGKIIGIQVELKPQNVLLPQSYLICRIPLHPSERGLYLVGQQNSRDINVNIDQIQLSKKISRIKRSIYLDIYIEVPMEIISCFTRQEKIGLIFKRNCQNNYELSKLIRYFPKQI